MARQSDDLVRNLVAAVEQRGGTVMVWRRDTHREHVELDIRIDGGLLAAIVEVKPKHSKRPEDVFVSVVPGAAGFIRQALDDFLIGRGHPTVQANPYNPTNQTEGN